MLDATRAVNATVSEVALPNTLFALAVNAPLTVKAALAVKVPPKYPVPEFVRLPELTMLPLTVALPPMLALLVSEIVSPLTASI